MKLIAGLGNPGAQYKTTRHNLGFLVIEAISAKYAKPMRASAGIKGHVAEIDIESNRCVLLMPDTFMNHSGLALTQVIQKKGIALSDILVICDDLSLPFGTLRIRPSGTAGGHNGLKSIIESLGSNQFARLRMGIDESKGQMDTSDYVLANFTLAEKKALPDFINTALDCVHSWVNHGAEAAMNQYNRRKEQSKET